MSSDETENGALSLIRWVTDSAIAGVPPLSSAEDLAMEYLIDASYPDHEERIESLIAWQVTKNFTSGFITGLGGVLTLPIALPASFAASWIIQARMAAAIARIAGFDLSSDKVQTFIVLCLVGDGLKDIVKSSGVQIAKGLTKSGINKISGQTLVAINKKVGFRLITKAGQKGAVNLGNSIPIVGGIVGGAFDAAACRVVGKNAKRLFYPSGTSV